MSTVYVIEHGSDPRPARVVAQFAPTGSEACVVVEFTDERGGRRTCLTSSVFNTKAEAVRAEKGMEKR